MNTPRRKPGGVAIEPLFGANFTSDGSRLTASMANLVPPAVTALLVNYGAGVVLAGGFVRSFLDNRQPADIDLWQIGDDPLVKEEFKAIGGRDIRQSEFALNVVVDEHRVQLITKWGFQSLRGLFESFDITVCQAAIYWNRLAGSWDGSCASDFWYDWENRQLRYTYPEDLFSSPYRSLRRFFKYRRAGYFAVREYDVNYLHECNGMKCTEEEFGGGRQGRRLRLPQLALARTGRCSTIVVSTSLPKERW